MAPRRAGFAWVAVASVLCVGLAGCGSGDDGSGVDPNCDSAAVEEEIHHIVAESTMTFKGLQSLQCSGDWSYAVAIVDTQSETASVSATISPFLFLESDGVLVLKSPHIVCGPVASGDASGDTDSQVPADLAPLACP